MITTIKFYSKKVKRVRLRIMNFLIYEKIPQNVQIWLRSKYALGSNDTLVQCKLCLAPP